MNSDALTGSIRFMTPRGTCTHCGGIIREYRGSESCLLCGREKGHTCVECTKIEQTKVKRAKSA
ncbi:MAG: hypothetical protein ACN4E2_03585 [Nitrospinota bacterium]